MSGDEPVRNIFDGQADVVLQAGSVQGGVHLHTTRPREAPRLVPMPTPHFINQRRVLERVDEAVREDSDRPLIVVLSGPPGVGKREVARYWLHLHSDEYSDGQFHADLSSGGDADGVVSAKLREFLLATGLDSSAIPDTVDGRAACFRSWSAGKRIAVVVDQALTPSQVRMLTPVAGRSVVLVSAARGLGALRIRDAATVIDLSPLEEDFAVDLLGRLAGPERVAGETEAARALVTMCERLPIAVCVVGGLLAARRFRRPGGLARLVSVLRDEQARLATLSDDDALSVEAVFNTSYQQLSPLAQRCHRVLGIHPGVGGRSHDVLCACVADEDEDAVVDAVDELVSAGLLYEDADGDRYRQHSLLRLHARGLASQEETSATLARIHDFYVRRAVRAGHAVIPGRGWLAMFFPDVLGDEDPQEALRWLRTEAENLRALVGPLIDSGRGHDLQRLAVALWPLHERDKRLDDLVTFNEKAVGAGGRDDRGLDALLRIQRAFGHLRQGDPGAARGLCEVALTGAEGIPRLEATAVETLGLVLFELEEHANAENLLRRNLEMATAIGEDRRLALARFHLAKVCPAGEAVPLLEDALAAFTEPGVADHYNAAKTRWWLGQRLADLGRTGPARAHLEEALAFMRAARMAYDQARILESLGDLAVMTGEVTAAARSFGESLVITESCGFIPDAARIRRKLDVVDGDQMPGATEDE